ncbi:hypothetical protein [Halodesulfovibrio sp.]|jgi:hypothetical protein|uniref:hypothetical protein n=1 Tax=Halodesulfovibrio sp. TaxID=1912772 RepID=UPI0025CF8CCD|nr:hypothetical protein [Halodesulfovibrio sp.]MCT4627907.1 hypothetical protein [Halodesulfovibrio sp.]
MDWNIFFSTVSQTSGAIIGIFAAFLITRIIASQTEFNQHKERLVELLQDSKKLANEVNARSFSWYNKVVAKDQLEELIEELYEYGSNMVATDYYDKLNFSPFQNKQDALQQIEDALSKENEKRQRELEAQAALKKRELEAQAALKKSHINVGDMLEYGLAMHGQAILAQPVITPHRIKSLNKLLDNRDTELSRIHKLFIPLSHQVDKNSDFLKSIKKGNETSVLINASLLAITLLFFVGVVYPLSLLPYHETTSVTFNLTSFWATLASSKGAILFLISLIFTGLMSIFFYTNLTLKYDATQIKKLEKYSTQSGYSEYLENYYNNMKDSAEQQSASEPDSFEKAS